MILVNIIRLDKKISSIQIHLPMVILILTINKETDKGISTCSVLKYAPGKSEEGVKSIVNQQFLLIQAFATFYTIVRNI